MFEKVVEMFTNAGFKGKYYDHNAPGCYQLEVGGLRVAVFAHDWCNTTQQGHVLADHNENFDKWSKAYYWCELPENQEQFDILLRDLQYIDNDADVKMSNDFGLLRRTF